MKKKEWKKPKSMKKALKGPKAVGAACTQCGSATGITTQGGGCSGSIYGS